MTERARALLGAALFCVTAACTDVGTDPARAASIELDPTPLSVLVVGDSLRDSLGRAVPLAARAFNSKNQRITGARITFLALDTARIVSVDSLSGFVVGQRVGQASVIASVAGLQSERIVVRVTLRPDSIVRLDSLRDSLQFRFGSDTSKLLRVRLLSDTTPAIRTDSLVPVADYLVRFAITLPPGLSATDTTAVHLANETRRPSTIDTTDVGGIAGRSIRLPRTITSVPDSVVVEARAFRPDRSPVPGSPVRFIIKIKR